MCVVAILPASEFVKNSWSKCSLRSVLLPSSKSLLLSKPFSQSLRVTMCESQATCPRNRLDLRRSRTVGKWIHVYCAFTFHAERGEDPLLLLFSQSSAFPFEEIEEQQKRSVKLAISDCPHNQKRLRNLSGENTDCHFLGRRVCLLHRSDEASPIYRYSL